LGAAGSLARTRRQAAIRRIAARILEAPDLAGLARQLTVDLPRALGAEGATLLLWDRRLESFERVEVAAGGALRRVKLQAGPAPAGAPRWLLSDGQILETQGQRGGGILVPLLARTGLAGTLALGPVPRRRRPVGEAEARLVSLIASRAALALENHAYQRELIASERLAALGTMAGMLAHDFRGPMTVIRGYAETLQEPGLPPSEVAARAALIVEAADRLSRMTNETLDFARGAERLVLRLVPLGMFLAELAAGIEQELPGLSVAREFRVDGTLRLPLDVDKLRRAVSNIAANARDAMGGRGRLELRVSVEPSEGVGAPSGQLVLELRDEGPGVPPEIRDRVFEPFVTLGKKRGTGLGLALARRFVEDHGGSLDLLPSPEPPAHGARFRLVVPIVASVAEPARPSEAPR
jgi:signal transduction histidine kinase